MEEASNDVPTSGEATDNKESSSSLTRDTVVSLAPGIQHQGSAIVSEMLDAGVVQPSMKFSKKSQRLTDEDKSKLSDMVKGLAAYRDCEDNTADASPPCSKSSKKSKKSPPKPLKSNTASSLSKYVDEELAILHEDKDKEQKKVDKAKSESERLQRKHVASVSEEQQQQFESLLKEELSAATGGIEDLHVTTGARPKVRDQNRESFNDDGDVGTSQPLLDEDGGKKGSNKKKKNKAAKKKDVVEEAASQELGSYSQLLKTMGKRSPLRKVQKKDDEAEEEDAAIEQFLNKGITLEDLSEALKDVEISPLSKRQKKRKRDQERQQNQQLQQNQQQQQHDQKQHQQQQQQQIQQQQQQQHNQQQKQQHKQKQHPEQQLRHQQQQQQQGNSQDQPGGRVLTGKKNKKKGKETSMSPPEQHRVQSRPQSAQSNKSSKKNTVPVVQQQCVLPEQESYPESYTEMTVCVPKAEHMYIIGPQGNHLREIMAATGVTVSVPPLNSPAEDIVLRGDRMQLGMAVQIMFTKSRAAQEEAMARYQATYMYQQDQSIYYNPQPIQGHGQYQSPQTSGQRQYQNQRAVGQGHCQTPKALGQGPQRQHKGREIKSCDEQNDVRNTPRGQGHKGHPHHEHSHHPHVVSTPLHHLQARGQHGGQGHPHKHGGTPKSEGKRQRNKKIVFTDYLPIEEVSQGLKRGILVQGPIRINPRNFEEAYVPHPDGKSDILISGLKGRNRALNGDEVAIQILDEGEWKINKDELESLETSMREDDKASQDSEPEVLIESEEIVEVLGNKSSSNGKPEVTDGVNKASGSGQKQTPKAKGNQPQNNKYTSLNDMKASQSPANRKLMTEEGKDEIKKMLQRTGIVVAIIERKHSRACTGFIKPMQNGNTDRALFCPTDHRLPRVMIPMSNCPKDFLERPEDHAKTLFVCRITDWRVDSLFADGHLAKSLGEAGEIEPETEGMLIENGVDFEEFPREAIDCLPKASPWTIPFEEFGYRRDYRTACVFTIDPATARDLDDALSCEDLGDGKYRVGVHIADVSFFVHENNVLDKVASLRSTSVYLVHKVIPMLPRLLCEQLCSLNPDEDRLTFSVEWIITEQGEIEEEWFGRSVIRSCVKLAYEHAQGFIEEPDREWTQDELPKISEGFTVNDIRTRVLNLHKIAVNLRKGRMDSGALRLDQVKLQYSLDPESGLPNGYSVYQQKDSNRLVEEFMLLANMAVAHRINREFPDKALLRRHPPPQEKMVENLRDQCSAMGISIDISSAGALQRSLSSYYGDDDDSMARMQVLVALCSKPMQNARYFCTGCLDDESLYHHYALNVPLYTHFTSPIRRYPDIIVHRLLAASLGYCKEPSRSSSEIQKLADHANDKKLAAKKVGDLSSELFFAVFVKTAGPLEEKAMVMGVLDKAFDIFVLRLGVSKRVYCDKLPIREKIYKRERKVPSLILVWNTEEGEPEIRQEISIFSSVDCVLEQGEQPLQWTAVIKRPQLSL